MALPYATIGFIGVGAMGKAMVVNLAKKTPATVPIYINDVVEEPQAELCGAFPSKIFSLKTAAEVASKADVIFTMVPEGRHVRAVYLEGATSISSVDLANKILIDCSTIDTATNLEVRAALLSRHPAAAFYDAPVSGGVLGAEKAVLGIYVGCAESAPHFAVLRELLSMMGSTIVACGGPSLGLVAKLANNYLSGTIAIATAEAMNMGMRAGLDAAVLARVIAAGSGKNHIADKFNPCPGICPEAPSSHGYRGGFKVELMRKDYKLATDMAKSVGAQTVLATAGLETYERASADPNCRGLDSRVVYRLLGGNENWQTTNGSKAP
ncbi:3-hydroxyacid dehydrogenase/reductase [Niveomyces insectorum RCEF 264]|uniref:3-hydroxyisobutyrate dehydrogenase n=1 Tax=Niveomyces insectorum RCEF 264 TaxID=1081102 RepID=A0A167T488_9HYPO|nr:3-hydroxyacid dehydrogenase/reductase [Niveomyces insectorum RCEF 264]